MLYVTTGNHRDAYTAYRVLAEQRGPDGRLYLPMSRPNFSPNLIRELGEKTFSQNVADIVNLLFNTELDSWAVEFAIGRYPVKLVNVSGRATIAETWHNPTWRFERLARGIEKAIKQSDQISPVPSDWLMIASRIAVLFGLFGELIHEGAVSANDPMDVIVPCGNFAPVMAAWYAREWGLPISTILVCCNENAAAWNLLHKGELRTDAALFHTDTPECDHVVPQDLERLIHAVFGSLETERFLECCRRKDTYYLEKYQFDQLRKGISVTVVSGSRVESTIKTLFVSDGYISDPYTALCYSGLIDYRSRTGERRNALILSEESPAFSLGAVSRSLGVSPGDVKKRIDRG